MNYLKLELPCGNCPISEDGSINEVTNPWFSSIHLDYIKQAQNLQDLRTIHLFSYLLSYEEGFFEDLVDVLQEFTQEKLLLRIHTLTELPDNEESCIDVKSIRKALEQLNPEQFLSVFVVFESDSIIFANRLLGGQLEGKNFNLEEQYLDELEENAYIEGRTLKRFST